MVHSAIRRNKDVIRAVQNWIFGGEYDAMIRQGDIAMMKMFETPRAAKVEETERLLLKTHQLRASELRENSNLYAKDPVIDHTREQHAQIRGKGWYRIIIGKRADFWSFAVPPID